MNELFRNLGLSTSTQQQQQQQSSNIVTNLSNENQLINPIIGDILDIGNFHLRLESLIAEGGFGYVFQAKDLKTSKLYAIKRMISSDKESKNEIENEINILEMIQSHRHIMKFYSYTIIKSNIYYILCEYCGNGSLKDLELPIVNKQQLNRIIYQITLAIEKLHQLNIIHRDIKIENILFDSNGLVKLCDFGSATTNSYKPDHNWTPIQRSLLEDDMNRHTTPMYRPPEILDTYLHYEINTSMDIWALGCLIFFLRFGQHPFEDSSKLRIINCKYSIPLTVNHQEPIIEIIKQCLQLNPLDRINCSMILRQMEENYVELNSPCISKFTTQNTNDQSMLNNLQSNANNIQIPGIAQSYFAGFTKYIKDTSNKVMQTVQNSIARQDLDMTFFTSRLIVMSYPAEGLESAYRNHIDDVRAVLESRDAPYCVVNISGRSYDGTIKFGPKVKVIDGENYWKDSKKVAPLQSIISLCDYLFKWVNLNNRNTIVIHCMDGKINSAMLTISFLLLIGLFRDYNRALKFFKSKRNTSIELIASQYRYLDYLEQLKNEKKFINFYSTKKHLIIKSIKMIGIPLFTKIRDGCRPFIDLYTNLSTKIYSTFTDYEKLIHYTKGINEQVIWRDINITIDLNSDLYLVVSHARLTIGSKMLHQQKAIAIKITSLQFNLFFEHNNSNNENDGHYKIEFNLTDLDFIDELDRFPFDFKIEIDYEIKNLGNNNIRNDTFDNNIQQQQINELEILLIDKPECIFVDNNEYDEFIEININKDENIYENGDKPILVDTGKNSNEIDLLNIQMNDVNLLEQQEENITNKTKNKVEKTDLLVNLSFGDSLEDEIKLDDEMKFSNEKSNNIDLFGNDDYNYSNATKLTTDELLTMDQSINLNDNLVLPTKNINPTINDSFSKLGNNLKSKNPSTPNLAATFDPFGDLNDYINFSNENKQSNQSSIPRVASFNDFPEDVSKINKNKTTTTTTTKTTTSTTKTMTTKQTRPDYSRHNFDDIISKTGLKAPRVNGNEFEDLLSGFKKSNADNNNNGNKTMAEIRKAEMLKAGANPIRLQVSEWTENKEKNIRALLCSLNTIIWKGCNWTPIGMHQLLTANDVKKMYRKACLAVHPDKLVGSPHEELAKYIFMELNDAWSEFEKNSK